MDEQLDDREKRSRRIRLVALAAVVLVLSGFITSLAAFKFYRRLVPERGGTNSQASVREVSVSTRPEKPEVPVEPRDYSASNVVSTLLGEEAFDDGVKHIAKERDGRTTVETVDGVPCRYLNRKAENKSTGFLYFAIDATFKTRELKAARIDVEYLVNSPGFFRLQYDAIEGETHRAYKTAVPEGLPTVRLGAGQNFIRVQTTGIWQTATFRMDDGLFQNSENGKSDFRIEVMPPEIYVRRVTVTREKPQLVAPK